MPRDASLPGRKPTAGDFALATEFIPHMAWVCTAERLVEYANTQLTDYTGLPLEGLLAWKWILSVHQHDSERIRLARDVAAQTRTPLRSPVRVRRFDGEYRWHFASDRAFAVTTVRSPDGSVLRSTSSREKAQMPTFPRRSRSSTRPWASSRSFMPSGRSG